MNTLAKFYGGVPMPGETQVAGQKGAPQLPLNLQKLYEKGSPDMLKDFGITREDFEVKGVPTSWIICLLWDRIREAEKRIDKKLKQFKKKA
jgi:hypothetical protein